MSQFNKTITLLDSVFAVYGDPIRAFESLSYSDAWEEHGALTLVVGADEFANLKDAAWLEVDGRVYENETQLADDEKATVKITGASLNVLFDRIVATADERLQGRLEERVRYLVNKYAVTGTQAVTGLTLGTDMGFARAMDATIRRGQTLSDFLYVQLNQRGFSFEIVCDCSTGALVFNVLCGLDRTQDQSVNAPVQISTRDALENASYKKSVKDYRNHAIVCDEDDTSPQTVEVDLSNGAPKRTMYVSGKSAGADDSAAPNLLVAVGNSGYIATSTDGINWTQRTSGTTNSLWSACYVNGLFAAGGTGGIVVVSNDAVNWSVKNTGSSQTIEGCGYNDGIYFAFDAIGAIYVSYDTNTWVNAFDGVDVGKIVNVINTPRGLLAYGMQYDGFETMLSQDGSHWERSHIPYLSGNVTCWPYKTMLIANKVVSVGYRNSSPAVPLVFVSSDYGETGNYYLLSAFSGTKFFDATCGNGVIVAVGCPSESTPGKIAYSADGEIWTDVTPSGSTDWYSVAFDGSQFCALGYGTRNVAISTDGMSWTVHARSPATGYIAGSTYGTSSHSGDLYQIGLDALQSAQVVETLDGDINADLAPVYETDYNIGDMIDAVDATREIVATKRVLSVEHLIDKDNDLAIIPKLGKEFLSLRQYIAKEIKKNGI